MVLGRINNFRTDPTGHVGALVMLGFAVWAGWRWMHTGLLFFLLLLLRDVAAVWFLVTRRPSRTRRTSWWPDAIAYLSSSLPLLYMAPTSTHGLAVGLVANLLPVVGFALSTIALLDLGESFGVAPANRGRVTSGIYRFLRHPMYTGYAIAELGLVLLQPWNFGIYVLSVGLYWRRARMESIMQEPVECEFHMDETRV